MGALLRLVIHPVSKIIALVLLAVRGAFRNRAVGYGFVAIAIVLGLGWYLLAGSIDASEAQAAQGQPVQTIDDSAAQAAQSLPVETISVPAAQILPPPAEVEKYLKAQSNYDAIGMWTAISEDLKAFMKDANPDASPLALQTELDAAKQQGHKYRAAIYVGGVPTRDGGSVYFYVLNVDGPEGAMDVPYIYVLDRDGKIVSIQ